MIYRNVRTGREVETSRPDWWLEASSGWELLPEPVAPRDNEPTPVGDKEEV